MAQPRANLYYAAAWRDPVAAGVSDTWTVELEGYAKQNSAQSPYCVPNEFVASRIGSTIGIPVPPGAAIGGPTDDAPPAWVTLAFTKSGEQLPPVDAAQVVRELPELAAGVVVFDLLIGNFDRHVGNLAYLPSRRRLEVFDHSHTLAGISAGGAVEWLESRRGDFLISGVSNRHCLLDHVASATHLMNWVDEVTPIIRDSLLRHSCEEATSLGMGLADDEAAALLSFLTHRRDNLRGLIVGNKDEFTAIPAEEWGLLL